MALLSSEKRGTLLCTRSAIATTKAADVTATSIWLPKYLRKHLIFYHKRTYLLGKDKMEVNTTVQKFSLT